MEGNAEINRTGCELSGKIIILPKVDKTLSKEGFAAEAKETGRKLAEILEAINNIDPGTAENVEYHDNGLGVQDVQSAIDYLHQLFTGGVFNTNCTIQKSSPMLLLMNNTVQRLGEIHYSNQENLIIANKRDDGNLVGIWIKPETENPDDYLDLGAYIDGEFKRYPIFGTHNKPTGKYTGNGVATSRTVGIGSGETLKISTIKGMAIVTGAGAICKKYSSADVYGLTASECRFDGGVLYLETADDVVNGNREYWYEVL